VRYVRPCPLTPSVTMGVDAAVTANTNSSNTATREINAAPNFFRVQVFRALKIPNLKRRVRSWSACRNAQFTPTPFAYGRGGPASQPLRLKCPPAGRVAYRSICPR
jgi:hypothetical protein